MASGDGLGDGQPQTRASLLTATGGIEAMEPLKDPPLFLRWDTRTAVQHEQLDLPAASLQTHPHRAASRAVLQGIAEQVDQQAAQFRFHPQNGGVAHLDRRLQGHRRRGGRFAEVLQHIRADLREVAPLQMGPRRRALQAGEEQQIGDQLLQPPALAEHPIQTGRSGVFGAEHPRLSRCVRAV